MKKANFANKNISCDRLVMRQQMMVQICSLNKFVEPTVFYG